MSSPMPDFEMPVEPRASSSAPAPSAPGAATEGAPPLVGVPPVRQPGPAPLVAGELTVEPEASDRGRPRRATIAWRQLLVAGLVGALLGAAVPASLQGIERAAAAADAETLRALASEYLTAIAEGRSADATALVPLDSSTGEIAPDAALAAASPIVGIEIGLVSIEGDIGAVAVRHRSVGAGRLVLDAERVDGDWRLTTSLAEVVTVYPSQIGDVPMVAGAPLHDRRSYLYPGWYELDEVDGPVFSTSGQGFLVDGDRATPVEVFPMTVLAPAIATLANEIGLRAGEACMASPGCPIPDGARLTVQQDPYVQASDPRGGTVDMGVPLMAGNGPSSEWFEVVLRMHYDGEGVPTAWECGRPGDFGVELSPCPGLG